MNLGYVGWVDSKAESGNVLARDPDGRREVVLELNSDFLSLGKAERALFQESRPRRKLTL